MKLNNHQRNVRLIAQLLGFALVIAPLAVLGQTKISYHPNKYSPSDDVKLGRQAAAEVERQMPILHDAEVTRYVQGIGERLVAAIPPEFQHPEFHYYFKVVDARDINAFALPGGPMYVNRGMIEAAHDEGEVAGVMAHELSHVALRHGTAQATKAQKYQYGAVAGAILGSILGGGVGSMVGQGAVYGLSAALLRFSREYETEADLLGARIMARAGYDPHDLANMFRTIEQQSGGGGGGFLSDHPSPKDRYARINQEAAMLHVTDPIQDNTEFNRIKARLRGYPQARTSAEISRSGQRYPNDDNGGYRQEGNINGQVQYPSSRYRDYQGGNLFRVSVPDNWRQFGDNSSITFAPEGAYNSQGQFTHGVMIGVAGVQANDLRQATDQYIRSLTQGNPQMRQTAGYQRADIAGRSGLETTLTNVNEVTGRQEVIDLVTTQLRDGSLFYIVGVAPRTDFGSYQSTFRNIVRSLQLNG